MEGRQPRPLSSVSHAGPADAEDLFRFLLGLRTQIGDGNVDDDVLADTVWKFATWQRGTAMIVRGDRGIEASIGVKVEPMPLSHECFLRSIWLVVAPEARLSGHAKSLVVAARELSARLDRSLVIQEFGLPSAFSDRKTGSYNLRFPHIDRRMRFLGRHLRPVGVIFNNVATADAA